MPERIQRRRSKGWKMPEGAVCVCRSTPWGNPFIVGKHGTAAECTKLYRYVLNGLIHLRFGAEVIKQAQSLQVYACDNIENLRGKDLACWCGIGKPCHADVLLNFANHNESHPNDQ